MLAKWRHLPLALGASILASSAVAAPSTPMLTAGAGRADIALTSAMLPIDGFSTIHDPLAARVLVVAQEGRRAAIVVVDQTSMGGDLVEAIKDVVGKETHTRASDVLVVASHTFSAPHLFIGPHLPPGMIVGADDRRRTAQYHDALMAAVGKAAGDAFHDMVPARIGSGTGVSDVNINRNVSMADGWWLGANPAGPSDKQLAVIRFDRNDGKPIALLVNYAVQSAVMDHSSGSAGKGVTADLGGGAVRVIEQQYGGAAVAMFLTGAAGDQLPGYTARRNLYDKDGRSSAEDLGDAGYGLLAVQADRLGADAVRAAQQASPIKIDRPISVIEDKVSLPAQPRPHDLLQIKPTRSYPFSVQGTTDAPFVILRIGDVAIVGVQAELSAETGASIRARSPFAHTLVVTMVNGAAKYMPERQGYADITYEAMNSSYGAGSAETFADAIVARLASLSAAGR